jgi:hypothetical protein
MGALTEVTFNAAARTMVSLIIYGVLEVPPIGLALLYAPEA